MLEHVVRVLIFMAATEVCTARIKVPGVSRDPGSLLLHPQCVHFVVLTAEMFAADDRKRGGWLWSKSAANSVCFSRRFFSRRCFWLLLPAFHWLEIGPHYKGHYNEEHYLACQCQH